MEVPRVPLEAAEVFGGVPGLSDEVIAATPGYGMSNIGSGIRWVGPAIKWGEEQLISEFYNDVWN